MLVENFNGMTDHFEPLRHKECLKHEKRPSENDILRLCETCGNRSDLSSLLKRTNLNLFN